MVFTHAFTPCPVCAPARQALLSGLNPDSFGAGWNYDFYPTKTVKPDWCWTGQLAKKGFTNGYLGRFHISPEYTPAEFGYGHYVSWENHKILIEKKYPRLKHTGEWLGCKSPIDKEDSGTHWVARQAAQMVNEFNKKSEPWHIWMDFNEPHLPCRPSEPFSGMYDPKDIPPWDGFGDSFENKPYIHKQQVANWGLDGMKWEDFAPMVARYYGVVSQLDDALGHLFKALRDSSSWDETIIVFTADHGDLCGSHQMLDKHYVLYDDITRVPLMVKHPKAKPGTSDALVSNCLDIAASVRSWYGLDAEMPTHGIPLPVPYGGSYAKRGSIVSASNGQQFGLYTTRMIRDYNYKYIWNLTDVDEFYDLNSDPGEKENLIGVSGYYETIKQMRERLYHQLKTQNDPFVGNEWMKRQLLEGNKIIR